jgi:protein-disulfide isomerase
LALVGLAAVVVAVVFFASRGGDAPVTAEVIPSPAAPVAPAPAQQVPATPAPAAGAAGTAQAPASPAAPAPATPAQAAPAQTAPAQTAPAQKAPAQTAQVPAGQPRTTEAMLQDRVLGNPDAPVTIIEYASMTCPHCASFHAGTLPELKKRYVDTGKAKLIFRDFPLDAVALRASMLARCAPAERYYGVLDVLFRSQDGWSRAQDPLQALAQTGRLAGVGQQEFEACMANQDLLNGVVNIRLEGERRFKVESTPTFVIRRGDREERIGGAQPIERFAEAIDRLGS